MRRMLLTSLLLLPASAGAGDAIASKPAIVVELFTSQGCSSCPPADALLSELAKQGDLLPMSFHVDYWDGIGWPDPFASADWTARQRRYASALDTGRGIYTPQLVIAGRSGMVGSQRDSAQRAISAAKARAKTGRVDFALRPGKTPSEGAAARPKAEQGGKTSIALETTITLEAGAARPLDVQLAILETGLSTNVPRGENGGRTLRNDYVVRRMTKIGTIAAGAKGLEALSRTVELDPAWARANVGFAIFVQDPETMEIHAAAKAALR